jgi:hypothetical protein
MVQIWFPSVVVEGAVMVTPEAQSVQGTGRVVPPESVTVIGLVVPRSVLVALPHVAVPVKVSGFSCPVKPIGEARSIALVVSVSVPVVPLHVAWAVRVKALLESVADVPFIAAVPVRLPFTVSVPLLIDRVLAVTVAFTDSELANETLIGIVREVLARVGAASVRRGTSRLISAIGRRRATGRRGNVMADLSPLLPGQ